MTRFKMASNVNVLLVMFILVPCLPVQCLSTAGCPMYGCTPSGSFSFAANVPRENASIAWTSRFFCGPVPDPLGCVGNNVSVVCQLDGLNTTDVGYVSIDPRDGAVVWKDAILKFPTLPIMNSHGDIVGSDGSKLVHYAVNGRLESTIELEGSRNPIFSLQLVGTRYILIVSTFGRIQVLLANGRLVESFYLNGTDLGTNGTFVPIAQPVANGNRFYVLTAFRRDVGDDVSEVYYQRLYAIDIKDSDSRRISIAWHVNIPNLPPQDRSVSLKFGPNGQSPQNQRQRGFKERPNVPRDFRKPFLLWHYVDQAVYVALPRPPGKETYNTFLGFRDRGNTSQEIFRSSLDVTNMVLFEPTSGDLDLLPNAGAQLWVSLSDSRICAIGEGGVVVMEMDISKAFKAPVKITSKMVTAREEMFDEDILIFGVKVTTSTPEFNKIKKSFGINSSNVHFVVGIDTPLNAMAPQYFVDGVRLMFLLPTPDDTEVKGQITVVPGTDKQMKDQLVFYAQVTAQYGKFFAVH